MKIYYYFQVLRVESPDGTKRVQVSITETSYDLFEKVIKYIIFLLYWEHIYITIHILHF